MWEGFAQKRRMFGVWGHVVGGFKWVRRPNILFCFFQFSGNRGCFQHTTPQWTDSDELTVAVPTWQGFMMRCDGYMQWIMKSRLLVWEPWLF